MRFVFLLSSMALGVAGQLLLKKGVVASNLALNIGSIFSTVFSPLVFTGLLLYGISAIIWLFVLQRFPLSVAYPSLALMYVVVVILSFFLLKEPLTFYKISGILLIVFGVYLLFR